jgi:hypothetical protein
MRDLRVKKGDRYWGMGCSIEVTRASSRWADIQVVSRGGSWTKRQPLPFPDDWERREPNLTTHEFDPDWCLHPGVHWREVVDESELNQVQIAEQMGVSQKHLSQILTCTAMPGVEATVAFANTMGVPAQLLWRLACDYKLDLVLGKKDITAEHL